MKLWGGRFEGSADKAADDFHSSLPFDRRLWRQDIRGSIAHAQMLGRQGIIPKTDAETIIAGLKSIYADIEAGKVRIEGDAEDIHSFVEAMLTERIGEPGKRLHTGRSRNDQVALDCRMYAVESCDEAFGLLKGLITVLLDIAEKHAESIMPGFTHLQKAQPVTLGFHMTAYVEMLLRDASRFLECRTRSAVMPLGSGALAGTTYPLDRQSVASELGFPAVTHNALDAVSDRDFVIDFIYACSVCMMHLSRLCEEIILWASDEYRFIALDDAWSTGSSIMPQKKNPDMAELIRGKTGRVYGDLMALLTTMKGLPLAYDKDMQEDKEAAFDASDTLAACVRAIDGMIGTMHVNADRMRGAAEGGFMAATDLADHLAENGVPFREAHEVVGKLVAEFEASGRSLADLTQGDLDAASPAFGEDALAAVDVERVVARRETAGGTNRDRVRQQLQTAKKMLSADEKAFELASGV